MNIARLAALIVALLPSAAAADAPGKPMLPPQPAVRPAGIPPNFTMVSPCVPGMGEHWADIHAGGLMGTTIYGTYRGKPVFTELMVRPETFAAGKSFENVLKPLPGYTIDHVDIEYLPHGHPGAPFPHYDIHGYYVPHAAHEAYCMAH
jgi:hypothetical protein